jgi:hypothetical protein
VAVCNYFVRTCSALALFSGFGAWVAYPGFSSLIALEFFFGSFIFSAHPGRWPRLSVRASSFYVSRSGFGRNYRRQTVGKIFAVQEQILFGNDSAFR